MRSIFFGWLVLAPLWQTCLAEPVWPRDFTTGSMQKIVAGHSRGVLVVSFWSVDCLYCVQELGVLKELPKRSKDWSTVFVSVDGKEHQEAAVATLRKAGIEPGSTWMFGEGHSQRLRHDIDRKWYGELPRTYVFESGALVKAFSGKIGIDEIDAAVQAFRRVN